MSIEYNYFCTFFNTSLPKNYLSEYKLLFEYIKTAAEAPENSFALNDLFKNKELLFFDPNVTTMAAPAYSLMVRELAKDVKKYFCSEKSESFSLGWAFSSLTDISWIRQSNMMKSAINELAYNISEHLNSDNFWKSEGLEILSSISMLSKICDVELSTDYKNLINDVPKIPKNIDVDLIGWSLGLIHEPVWSALNSTDIDVVLDSMKDSFVVTDSDLELKKSIYKTGSGHDNELVLLAVIKHNISMTEINNPNKNLIDYIEIQNDRVNKNSPSYCLYYLGFQHYLSKIKHEYLKEHLTNIFNTLEVPKEMNKFKSIALIESNWFEQAKLYKQQNVLNDMNANIEMDFR